MKTLLAIVTTLCGVASFAADGIWIKPDTGTAPLTAADYSASANWANGYVPGEGDSAYFTNDFNVARYIRLPDEYSLGDVFARTGGGSALTVLLGGALTLEQPGAKGGSISYANCNTQCQHVFADINAPYGFSMSHAVVSGDLNAPSTATVTLGGGLIGYDTSDFANSNDRVRYPWGHMSIGQVLTGSPTLVLTGPNSSPTSLEGVYAVQKGSPYLTWVSGTKGRALVVGSTLSGSGIPADSYVKRIFGDSCIEISAPATEDVSGSAIVFDPLVPEVHLEARKWMCSGSPAIYFDSLGRETDFRVETLYLEGSESVSLRVSYNTPVRQYGTWVTHTTKNFRGTVYLGACNFVFAEAETGETAGFPNAKLLKTMSDTTTILTVTNGISAVVSRCSDVQGTLAKSGEGTLSTTFSSEGNTGTLDVREGVLSVTSADIGKNISAVKIAAGATLKVAEGVVLTVGSLQAEAGAVIAGPGTLAFTGAVPDLSGIVLKDGALIRVSGAAGAPVLEPVAGSVVGNPALWLKADDTSTMTLDGANVLRWNDCRGTGYLFATNLIEKPTLASSAAGNYVNFLHRNVLTHYLKDEQVLVWSDVVRDIRVVFAVIDPADGGGYVLGRSSRIPDAVSPYCGTGGFFYRENNGWWKPIWSTSVQPAGSSIYLDGEKVAADATFREPSAQLVEIHLPAGSGFMADALGSGFSDGGSQYAANGNLRAHEYIIYTNELSSVERQKVAQYLMKKWLKHDAPVVAVANAQPISLPRSAGSNGGIEVVAGETVVIGSLGEGEFVKAGEGSLYAHEIDGGNLRVAGGEAVIHSFALTAATLPRDESCYLHLDATVDDSIVKSLENGTNFVTRWNDVRGTEGRHYVTKPGSDISAPTENGWLHENVLGGKPMVDLGPMAYDKPASGGWGSPKPFCGLTIKTPSGAEVPGTQRNGWGGPDICSIFMVYDSSGGGGALLAARGNSYTKCGLETWRDPEGEDPKAMFNYPNINSSGLRSLYDGVKNYAFGEMSVLLRHNGSFFDPWATKFSGSQDVFVLSSAVWPRRTASFAIEQLDRYAGGLMYGEIILYTNFVGQVESKQIEAYLLKKWKGVDTPGYTAATLDRLTLENGATVKVFGGAPLTVTTLNAAGGAVEGAVKLASNAVLEVPVLADGTLGSITLGADFDYSAGAAVRLVGNVEKAVPGTYAVVTSPAVTAADAAKWSFTDPAAAKRTYAFSVIDGAVRVSVSKFGVVLIVR